MKANSRRRVLISSMCMLLVALVALSTATFAWFSSNKQVTASGMTVKAAAAQGLVISDDNWQTQGNTSTFTTIGTYTLTPVSVGYDTTDGLADTGYYPGEVKAVGGGVWSTEDKDDYASWTATTEDDIPVVPAAKGTESAASTTYFADYAVQIKSTSTDATAKIEGVYGEITFTDTTDTASLAASNYVRIAVYDKDGNVVKVLGNETDATAITDLGSDGTPVATDQTALTEFTSGTALKFVEGVTVTNVAQTYKIRVWFEGQDDQCVDDYQQAMGNIQLKFAY